MSFQSVFLSLFCGTIPMTFRGISVFKMHKKDKKLLHLLYCISKPNIVNDLDIAFGFNATDNSILTFLTET